MKLRLPRLESCQHQVTNFQFLTIGLVGGTVTQHSALVDDKYMTIGANIDVHLREKIQDGTFVDFSKLLPHERTFSSSDQKLELINRVGHTFFVPVEIENGVTNLFKWE